MPAYRLGSEKIDIAHFDAIGSDGSEQGFVVHLGLAAESITGVLPKQRVRAVHVAPPAKESTIVVDVVGSVGLTYNETMLIQDFVNRHVFEVQAEAVRDRRSCYVLCPHVAPVLGDDGEVIYTRFSCAGFVVEAFKEAGILAVDVEALPKIKRARLAVAYSFVNSPRFEEWNEEYEWGLDINEKEWPVLMPGYVLHAFDRIPDDVRKTPYRPRLGDELFLLVVELGGQEK